MITKEKRRKTKQENEKASKIPKAGSNRNGRLMRGMEEKK
jgi:hypothetical protein